MAQQQIPKGICIYQKSMTSSANKVNNSQCDIENSWTDYIIGHSTIAFKAYIRILSRKWIISQHHTSRLGTQTWSVDSRRKIYFATKIVSEIDCRKKKGMINSYC